MNHAQDARATIKPPHYLGQVVLGSYSLVFNAILNFDNLNAGRNMDQK